MSVLVSSLNHSAARCGDAPKPEDAKLYFPGLARTSSISCVTSLAGIAGRTTRRLGKLAISATAAKSRSGSYGRSLRSAGEQRRGGAGAHEERVAVGRGLCGRRGAGRAGRAGDVLDHHRACPRRRSALGHQPRHDVGRAAGRERHHDAYGLFRIGRGRLRCHRLTSNGANSLRRYDPIHAIDVPRVAISFAAGPTIPLSTHSSAEQSAGLRSRRPQVRVLLGGPFLRRTPDHSEGWMLFSRTTSLQWAISLLQVGLRRLRACVASGG